MKSEPLPRLPEIRVQLPSNGQEDAANTSVNEPDDGLVDWTGTFSRRTSNLASFPVSASAYRATYRSQSNSINRAKIGCITNTTKSLNTLRQALQRSLNKEIHDVIQKYLDNFFRPAVENIKQNNGANSVSDHHLQSVCQKILEEAKKMYFVGLMTRQIPVRDGTGAMQNHHHWDSDNDNLLKPPTTKKRTRSPTDSESEDDAPPVHDTVKVSKSGRKKKKFGQGHSPAAASRAQVKVTSNDQIVRTGPRWDPDRLTLDTKFVLGSKANKALGFGMTRGRLYTKHADLFRYIGDQEDKQWLSERGLMPPAGGRAYLLIKEDIEDLIQTDEYKGVSGVNAKDMGAGFGVPELIINKMKRLMDGMRTKQNTSPKEPVQASSSMVNRPESAASSIGSREAQLEGDVLSPADDIELPQSQEECQSSAVASPFSTNSNQDASQTTTDLSSLPNNDH